MRTPAQIVKEYRARGYSDARLRALAAGRNEPVRSELLAYIDAHPEVPEASDAGWFIPDERGGATAVSFDGLSFDAPSEDREAEAGVDFAPPVAVREETDGPDNEKRGDKGNDADAVPVASDDDASRHGDDDANASDTPSNEASLPPEAAAMESPVFCAGEASAIEPSAITAPLATGEDTAPMASAEDAVVSSEEGDRPDAVAAAPEDGLAIAVDTEEAEAVRDMASVQRESMEWMDGPVEIEAVATAPSPHAAGTIDEADERRARFLFDGDSGDDVHASATPDYRDLLADGSFDGALARVDGADFDGKDRVPASASAEGAFAAPRDDDAILLALGDDAFAVDPRFGQPDLEVERLLSDRLPEVDADAMATLEAVDSARAPLRLFDAGTDAMATLESDPSSVDSPPPPLRLFDAGTDAMATLESDDDADRSTACAPLRLSPDYAVPASGVSAFTPTSSVLSAVEYGPVIDLAPGEWSIRDTVDADAASDESASASTPDAPPLESAGDTGPDEAFDRDVDGPVGPSVFRIHPGGRDARVLRLFAPDPESSDVQDTNDDSLDDSSDESPSVSASAASVVSGKTLRFPAPAIAWTPRLVPSGRERETRRALGRVLSLFPAAPVEETVDSTPDASATAASGPTEPLAMASPADGPSTVDAHAEAEGETRNLEHAAEPSVAAVASSPDDTRHFALIPDVPSPAAFPASDDAHATLPLSPVPMETDVMDAIVAEPAMPPDAVAASSGETVNTEESTTEAGSATASVGAEAETEAHGMTTSVADATTESETGAAHAAASVATDSAPSVASADSMDVNAGKGESAAAASDDVLRLRALLAEHAAQLDTLRAEQARQAEKERVLLEQIQAERDQREQQANQFEDLRTHRDEESRLLARRTAERDALHADLERLRVDVDAVRAKHGECARLLAAREASLAVQNDEVARLRAETRGHRDLADKYKTARAELESLRHEWAELHNSHRALTESVVPDLEQDKLDLQEMVEERSRDRDALRGQLVGWRRRARVGFGAAAAAAVAIMALPAFFSAQADPAVLQLAEVDQARLDAVTRAGDLEKDNDSLRVALQSAERRASEAQGELLAVQLRGSSDREGFDRLQNELVAARRQAAQLQQEREQLAVRLANAESERTRANAALALVHERQQERPREQRPEQAPLVPVSTTVRLNTGTRGAPSPAPASAERVATVRAGDSIASIVERELGTRHPAVIAQVIRLNKLKPNAKGVPVIHVGDTLRLPVDPATNTAMATP